MARDLPHPVTLVAISSLAYILAVALHEHLGHSAACGLLGSRPLEMGAFYVDCDDARLSTGAIRAVAAAGPLVSLLTGMVCVLALPRLPVRAPRAFYFVWLLGTLGLMSASGYLLFSGVSGLGDLGTGAEGALMGAHPQWLWRIALTLLGVLAYKAVVMASLRRIAPRLPGTRTERIRTGRRVLLISYLTGALIYLLIGLANPRGLAILLLSVLPASLGASSGLLWMMQRIDSRTPVAEGPGLQFGRSVGWIAAAAVLTGAYAIVFGPTLRA
jgi:hypothetical protein